MISAEKKENETLYGWQVARSAYPARYLYQISYKIGIGDKARRKAFVRGVRKVGERYFELVRINKNRLQPNEQNKLLEQYKDALILARGKYKEIQNSVSASGKLGKAIRHEYDKTTEPGMKEMFEPYCNSSSMSLTLFDKFLGVLAEAAENAKAQDIGNDKADLSAEFLTMWIAAIGKFWPEEARIKFALGKYDSTLKIYTSSSLPILRDIVCKIKPNISEKDIETAMRKVKEKDLVNQPLAYFFLS